MTFVRQQAETNGRQSVLMEEQSMTIKRLSVANNKHSVLIQELREEAGVSFT